MHHGCITCLPLLGIIRFLISAFSMSSFSIACPSVFENVTWNDVVYGDVDVQPCPRGAKGLHHHIESFFL